MTAASPDRVDLGPVPRPPAGWIDARFVAGAVAWGVAALITYGLVTAIVPNPVFGRQIPPEPFAIVVWLLSAPLMGVVAATYTVRRPAPRPVPLEATADVAAKATSPAGDGSLLGTIGGVGAFLAIGCPVCNKIALVLLGTSGALTVFGPLQPVIGAASLGLLAATAAWRLRMRRRGDACPT